MDILTLIKSRRSIRRFKEYAIPRQIIERILEAGRWAPSGLNNQPWRFMVLTAQLKSTLAQYTRYSYIVKEADKVILVFLDKKTSYNYEKDLLAIGACIQNMLLCIHSSKLAACWLGEILNRRKEINKILKLKGTLQLEAAIAIGKPAGIARKSVRRPLKNLLIARKLPSV